MSGWWLIINRVMVNLSFPPLLPSPVPGSPAGAHKDGLPRRATKGSVRVMRSFNTTGPCVSALHYMLPPQERLGYLMRLLDESKYFVLYAGHQTGKTTCVRWLVEHYNQGSRYACAWVDLQEAREEPDPAKAMRTILGNLDRAICRDLPNLAPPSWSQDDDPSTVLRAYLQALSQSAPRPVCLFLDEADGLLGATLLSFLAQLRAGYLDRSKTPFPASVVLVGRKQLRDYALSLEDRRAVSWLGTSSPFNVTAEAITLRAFTQEDVERLLGQHTQETGQPFLAEARDRIFYLSQGHPWLVNALADRIVSRDQEDRQVAITAAHVDAAKETLILERRTHIDSLVARLHEERVVRIIQPMLLGEETEQYDTLHDDFAYVRGLGLIAKRGGQYQIANPIYQEIIPRVLSYDRQVQLNQQTAWYLLPDGNLDMKKLMPAFLEYWREDGHLAAAGFKYRQAGPHLILMAFLQRIVNGGGQIQREYGLGRKALDLLLTWPRPGLPPERHAIEIKLYRDRTTEGKGRKQLANYLDGLGLKEGWLVLVETRKGKSWREKLTVKRKREGDHRIWVVGC